VNFAVTIDGTPAEAIFDTGAGRTVFNWAAARQVGLAPDTRASSSADPRAAWARRRRRRPISIASSR
jgi:predicted aspartyl protease